MDRALYTIQRFSQSFAIFKQVLESNLQRRGLASIPYLNVLIRENRKHTEKCVSCAFLGLIDEFQAIHSLMSPGSGAIRGRVNVAI